VSWTFGLPALVTLLEPPCDAEEEEEPANAIEVGVNTEERGPAEIDLLDPALETASITIQAGFRGHMARKEARQRRLSMEQEVEARSGADADGTSGVVEQVSAEAVGAEGKEGAAEDASKPQEDAVVEGVGIEQTSDEAGKENVVGESGIEEGAPTATEGRNVDDDPVEMTKNEEPSQAVQIATEGSASTLPHSTESPESRPFQPSKWQSPFDRDPRPVRCSLDDASLKKLGGGVPGVTWKPPA